LQLADGFNAATPGPDTMEDETSDNAISGADAASEDGCISPLPAVGTKITLEVGEQRFVTTAATLTEESGFFSSLLSGRWDNTQEDGSYFIDADADLFKHILRYLRRGVLPIFYDNLKGHDHGMYLALLEEAKYFQIPRLEKWIRDKEYFQAVKITRTALEREGVDAIDETTGTDIETDIYPVWTTEKVYVCPRNITVHRGNPSACGKTCRKVQGDADDEYVDEPLLRTVVIRKRTMFDQQACIEGR